MIFTAHSETFPLLYQRFQIPISQYIRRTVHDGETALELTQEVFLKAFRARETFQDQRSFAAWIWTIARNTVCDWHRKHADDPRREVGPFDSENYCETLPSPIPDAEALLSRKNEQRNLALKLKALTKLQRRVLWLRLIRGLPYAQVAPRMGLTVSATKCLFYRARLTLATC